MKSIKGQTKPQVVVTADAPKWGVVFEVQATHTVQRSGFVSAGAALRAAREITERKGCYCTTYAIAQCYQQRDGIEDTRCTIVSVNHARGCPLRSA